MKGFRFARHAPGDDGRPVCHHKDGAVVHGEAPTCAFCRKLLGMPTTAWEDKISQVVHVGRPTYVQRAHAVLWAAWHANGCQPIPVFATLDAAGIPENHAKPPVRVLLRLEAITIARMVVPKPVVLSIRGGQPFTRISVSPSMHLTAIRPIPTVAPPTKAPPSAVRLCRAIARATPTKWAYATDVCEPFLAKGHSTNLCAEAIHEAVRRGWIESKTRNRPMQLRLLRMPEAIGPLPGAPKRIATPGAKRRAPRLAVDVEVMPACDRLDADGVPVAVPTPDTEESASIVESITRRPLTTANARSTAALVSTAPVRRVDVAPLLDDDLAAQLRAMLGAP